MVVNRQEGKGAAALRPYRGAVWMYGLVCKL